MADHNTADHAHGTMDIREQQKTFSGFLQFASWVTIIAIVALVFLALSNA